MSREYKRGYDQAINDVLKSFGNNFGNQIYTKTLEEMIKEPDPIEELAKELWEHPLYQVSNPGYAGAWEYIDSKQATALAKYILENYELKRKEQ